MPLNEGTEMGTEADGSASGDYCSYCYQGGRFVQDVTVEGMIDICVPYMLDEMSEAEARKILSECLPRLKRWA